MGSNLQNLLIALLVIGAGITAFVLVIIFIAVPIFRGVGAGIGLFFRAIGWFFAHLFEFIGGVLGNLLRFVGSLLAMLVFVPMVPLNVIIGRWSAASHFAQRIHGECKIGAASVYRALIHHPLKLFMLHGLLEGLEQRVPDAMLYSPGADQPSHRAGQFNGYTIVGSLRAGGSGAKLYVAKPDADKRRKLANIPERVVIKSFALTEGSSLPQIVRESRALECAKQLGLVFDHGMEEHRFFYVMPYHPGEHLGVLTRQLHGECGNKGLDQKRLDQAMSYTRDLLATLAAYHRGGLWHKDVKPENVIVHDGYAHLVDLGLVTPLKSAMTLTTHGTEYFRDPEMVRQALRGVKVHQVDGAKFDVYGVGAVLYFMIENTFPAHGGLSRFVTHSPDALRWIVRRAMTEYHQRYTSADEMLADLNFVMKAGDAFAVKPAALPSMSNEGAASVADPYVEASAGNPHPSNAGAASFGGFGISAGIDERGVFAHVGKLDENGNPVPVSAPQPPAAGRPRLTVTNWWTGEYRVQQDQPIATSVPPPAATEAHSDARAFREQAFAFRHQAEEIGRQARAGTMSARRAAREQIRAARQRARDIRSRALTHRHRVVSNRRPTALVALITVAVIGVVATLVLGSMFTLYSARSANSSGRMPMVSASGMQGEPLLFAIDAASPLNEATLKEIAQMSAQYRDRGYTVVIDDTDAAAAAVPLIRKWNDDPNGLSDQSLEDLMAKSNVYGVLHIKVEDGRRGRQNLRATMIHSTRPDAPSRRRSVFTANDVPIAPTDGKPYLLINDHPAKADEQVAARIEQMLRAYRERGWIIEFNDDAEVNVRRYLPAGAFDPKTLSPMINLALASAELGGVLRIDSAAGDGPLPDRVVITRIDAKPVERDTLDAGSSEPSSMANDSNEVAAEAVAGLR